MQGVSKKSCHFASRAAICRVVRNPRGIGFLVKGQHRSCAEEKGVTRPSSISLRLRFIDFSLPRRRLLIGWVEAGCDYAANKSTTQCLVVLLELICALVKFCVCVVMVTMCFLSYASSQTAANEDAGVIIAAAAANKAHIDRSSPDEAHMLYVLL